MKKQCIFFALLHAMPMGAVTHDELKALPVTKKPQEIIDAIKDKNTTESDLQKIAQMTFKNIQDMQGATAMHILATHNDYEPVVRLYKANKKFYEDAINARDAKDKTPLHYAAQYNADEVIKALLTDPHTNIFAKNSTGMTAVHYAVRENALKALAQLLKGRTGEELYDDLMYSGIARFPSINIKDNSERTPLHYAAISKNKEAAQMLYNESGNLPVYALQEDVDKKTALDYWPELINLADSTGNTPLHYALYELLAATSDKEKKETPPLVLALIDKNADLSIKNKKGETPAQLLYRYKNVPSAHGDSDLRRLALALKSI